MLKDIQFRHVNPRMFSDFPGNEFSLANGDVVMSILDSFAVHRKFVGMPIVAVGPRLQVIDGRHHAIAAQIAGIDVPVLVVSEAWFEGRLQSFPPVLSLEDIANLARSHHESC